jgi:hypothetical protein
MKVSEIIKSAAEYLEANEDSSFKNGGVAAIIQVSGADFIEKIQAISFLVATIYPIESNRSPATFSWWSFSKRGCNERIIGMWLAYELAKDFERKK